MKDVFLLYDTCCMYEIVLLNYFMQYTKADVLLVSVTGQPITTMEGYKIVVDGAIDDVDTSIVRSFIITGGHIDNVNTQSVKKLILDIKKRDVLIGGICAGVDLLNDAGVLSDLESTHSKDVDLIKDNRVVTARANAYVDFAIEIAKELKMFTDEKDLQETINFFKYHKRM
ncbi:MAG: DJ-1/PfpI family protein [Eubacteriales bacterium]